MLKNVEKISGSVIKVIFEKPENMFRIMVVRDEDGEEMTCVGEMPPFKENDDIDVWGKYKKDPRYGLQLEVMIAELQKPKTKKAVIEFLANSTIKGVGKKTAKKIFDTFGEDSIDIVYEETERLMEVPGMTENKLSGIIETLDESRTSREIRLFLVAVGVSYKMAYKIFDEYKEDTVKVVKNNPYQLIDDFSHFGFYKADEIARNLGFDNESEFRISAGIEHVLERENVKTGNTNIDYNDLVIKVSSLLRIKNDKIVDVINDKLKDKSINSLNIDNNEYIYSKEMYDAEKYIARTLSDKSKHPYIFDVNVDINPDKFADEQVEAIKAAFKNMLLVITGGPGTGKTTITKAMIDVLEENGMSYCLLAPTGRAAKRMSESTKKPAYTIHRAIGIVTWPFGDSPNLIPCDYIIVDEVSMVDTKLMEMLLKVCVDNNTALILVGDANQLPSVGPGNVLKDIINTNVKTVRLNKIFRQDEKSDIVINAHKINKGEGLVINNNKGFYFIGADKDNFEEVMLDLVSNRLPNHYEIDKINDIQILCPSKKNDFGTISLNKTLQNVLNPLPKELIEEHKNKLTGDPLDNYVYNFRVGDKVMQTSNNYKIEVFESKDRKYGIFNGDIGIVTEIDYESKIITVKFDDGAVIKYTWLDMIDLVLSYAITIHKSQGSEFKCVVIPVMPAPPMLLNRNLLYTAVTRAKDTVVLVGEKRIIAQMVDNNSSEERLSNIDYFINRQI